MENNINGISDMEHKKKRGANFTSAERQLLIKLTNKFRHVVENKKTDGITWREKEMIWKKIEQDFNANTSGQPRSAKQLKFKYEAIKKEMKKNYSTHKVYMNGTGGGDYVSPPKPQTEEEKLLLETIVVSVEGLQSQYDSDALAGIRGIPIQEVEKPKPLEYITTEEVEGNIDSIDVDWAYPSSSYLQTPIHPKLKRKRSFIQECEMKMNEQTPTLSEIVEIPCEDTHLQKEHDYTQKSQDISSTCTSGNWTSRRRPRLSKKKSMTSASAKFESLATTKMKLVEELRAADKLEHELKMKNLSMKYEILELKKQLLLKKLNE